MFNFDGNKTYFEQSMKALKEENQLIKTILKSKEYKRGRYINELKRGFSTPSDFKKYINNLKGKLQWSKLCRKYPIDHSINKNISSPNYFSSERIVIYTSIFGAYDNPQEPLFVPDNCDYYIITDQKISTKSAWKAKNPESLIQDYTDLSNAEKNRYCKMLPHILFPEYRYSIYIDGNIKSITDLTELVNRCNDSGMALHLHKARKCVYEEIEACKILGKAPVSALEKFQDFLEKEKFPKNYGLNDCSVIVRDHKNPTVIQIMNEWWTMFHETEVKRDQLIFPYLLYLHHLTPYDVGVLGNNVQDNPALRVTTHR